MKHFDLTNSQLMIWTGQKLNPDSPQYNMAFSIRFEAMLDEARFAEAHRSLVESVDVLRSRFIMIDGVPKMEFVAFTEDILSILTMNTKDWEEWEKESTSKVFDISAEVFRSTLVKLEDDSYVWYINQHHLITDGWAFTTLVNRMMAYYLDGEVEVSPGIKDKLTNRKPKQKSLDYWRSITNDVTSPPIFNGKTNEQLVPYSERIQIELSKTVTEELKTLVSQQELRLWSVDLGLFNLFLTVLATTTHRLTNKKEVSIGAPALNRFTAKEKNTIGLFIEMFPIRAKIVTGETYISLYRKYSQDANNFLRYAAPDTSSAALNKSFNVVLNYINASFLRNEDLGMKSTWLHPRASDPGHHISLQVTDFDTKGAMTLSFDMNDHVFNLKEKTIFIETFMLELDKFIKDKQQLINPREKDELDFIDSINMTDVPYPEGITLIDLFEKQVSKNGDQVAVIFEGESMTFRELDDKSNQLAHFLLDKGTKKEESIGILLDRSFELVIAILAIIKAGGAYVPIDVNYPEARKAFIIGDAGINVVISKETTWSEVYSFSTSKVEIQVNPEDLIYTIYTSGSTGVPKGVMNQHSGVFNRLYWQMLEFDLGREDVILQKTTYCFDVSVVEFFLPLITGSKLVLASSGRQGDSDYLQAIIDHDKITYLHFVPPMLEIFLLSIKKGDCPSLRYVICSGEALSPSLVNKFGAVFPEVQLYNLFGPTEAAIEVSAWKAPKNKEVQKVPIGKPIANVKLKVVDEFLDPCSIGVPGELLIGGVQVSRGYKNRPELNADRFIESEGCRWYRTGDLCQWLRDGSVEFFGRMDNQVKVRGFRVELGEIEQILKSIEEVIDAVVVVKDQTIVAFITCTEEVDFRSALQLHLPDYMLPSQITVVEKIPYLNNGKINRRGLLESLQSKKPSTKPTNEFQEFVHGIWCNLLKVKEIDINESFFNIGGDSLSGIRIITEINKELDLEFPVVLIFQKTTISDLASHIEAEIDKRLQEV